MILVVYKIPCAQGWQDLSEAGKIKESLDKVTFGASQSVPSGQPLKL